MKLLHVGLTIDSLLSFKAHIKSIYAIRSMLKLLLLHCRRVRKFIPPEAMVNIYKAFILPHFEYCAPVFSWVIIWSF